MTFTAPPAAPSQADPANFPTRGDAFLTWFATFQAELEANWPTLVGAINSAASVFGANTSYGTSTTSNAIGTGSKTWTIETGRGFQKGQYVIVADSAAPTVNYALGRVDSYNSGTGALVVVVDTVAGSGTKTAWTVALGAVAGRPAATSTNVRQGSSSTVDITPLALFQAMAFQTLTDASTIAWDVTLGWNAKVTIGASRIMGAPTGLQDGMSVALAITQGTGGNFTMTWNSIFDFGQLGAPTLSTAAGKADIVFGFYSAATGKIHVTYWKSA